MTDQQIAEIEAQVDSTTPYYVPRLIRDLRNTQVDWGRLQSDFRRVAAERETLRHEKATAERERDEALEEAESYKQGFIVQRQAKDAAEAQVRDLLTRVAELEGRIANALL